MRFFIDNGFLIYYFKFQRQDIYYNELLVTVHSLSSNIFNYKNEHYKDALKIRISSKGDDSIEEMASNNLKMFDYMKK